MEVEILGGNPLFKKTQNKQKKKRKRKRKASVFVQYSLKFIFMYKDKILFTRCERRQKVLSNESFNLYNLL